MAKKSSKSSSKAKKADTVPNGELTPADTQAATSLAPPRGERGVQSGPLSPDDEKVAAERVEGRTSDAASRSEDVRASAVPPDINASAKPSDGGDEVYPFPPQGDVDIATIPTKSHKGEKTAPLPVGSWVRLGVHDDVPERLQGRIAYVVDSPTVLCNCDYAPRTHEHQAEDAGITVKTRDEVNATLTLPLDAFTETSVDGRHGVEAHG